MYQEGLDDNTIDEMMAAADTNQDGEIDLAEFKLIMGAAGPQKRLEEAFAKVDTDKSGKISAAEMKAYMYQEGLDDNTIDEMMAAADTNQDGEIDLAEFKLIMRAKPKKM
jgi:Ca2+-binding EF-hand superfamily protein